MQAALSAFAAFLPDPYATYQWRIATGYGFDTLAEEHSGCDLTILFDAGSDSIYPTSAYQDTDSLSRRHDLPGFGGVQIGAIITSV